MDMAARQPELDAVTWYHEFDFGNGRRTKTHCGHIDHHRRVWEFVESHLAAVDFRGKSVLDIGAWDGYWSFYAEKSGAGASSRATTWGRTGRPGAAPIWHRLAVAPEHVPGRAARLAPGHGRARGPGDPRTGHSGAAEHAQHARRAPLRPARGR